MKQFKNIIIILFIFLFSCSTYIYLMKNIKNEYYSKYQIDSICLVENIPSPSKALWITHSIISDENEMINQYTYIKHYQTTERTYICTEYDTIYNFTIRELTKIKK